MKIFDRFVQKQDSERECVIYSPTPIQDIEELKRRSELIDRWQKANEELKELQKIKTNLYEQMHNTFSQQSNKNWGKLYNSFFEWLKLVFDGRRSINEIPIFITNNGIVNVTVTQKEDFCNLLQSYIDLFQAIIQYHENFESNEQRIKELSKEINQIKEELDLY